MGSQIALSRENANDASRIFSLGLIYLLPILAFATDLITPYFIWKGLAPAAVRWVSHGAIAVMILFCLVRMVVLNHYPRILLLIGAISAVWVWVAIGQGQGISATLWGCWQFFQFPVVAMYVYLQPNRTPQFAGAFRKICLILLAFEVLFQCFQLATGDHPGDSLAGTIGRSGSQQLALFTIMIICLFFGEWIATKQWKGLVASLALSTTANLLAENKLIVVAIIALGLASVLIYSVKYKVAMNTLALYTVLITGALIGFYYFYDMIFPSNGGTSLESYITDPGRLRNYLNFTSKQVKYGSNFVYMGRNYALNVGWQALQRDNWTFLFGYGLGSRSESRTLGTAGVGFQQGFEGLSVGTSLVAMMQELGMVGLAMLEGFFIWLIIVLAHDIRRNPHSPAVGMRYGVILFTIFWPLWLWYITIWTERVPMLVYWLTVGYVFAEAWQEKYVMGFQRKVKGLGIND